MTTTHLTGDRRPGTARGLAALVALAVLVVVPPLGLITAVGNPMPRQILINGRFTDAAVTGMLAAVVWLAWAQLILVVTIETIAAVRGRSLPRLLPGCSAQQRLARHLVVAVSVLLTGLAGTVTAGTATAGAATGPATTVACAIVPTAEVSDLPSAVRPATAERPTPISAVAAPVVQPPAAAPIRELWYVVRPPHGRHHDSLWDIAERHLGDGLRWREIYELNRHRSQPDGRQLDLARLIQPGWRLLMPADATGLPEHKAQHHKPHRPANRPADPAPGGSSAGHGDAPDAEPAPAASTAHAAAAAVGPAPAAPGPRIPAPSSPVRQTSRQLIGPRTAVPEDDDQDAVPFGRLTLGLSALACAGVCAELSRRRRRAQRTRRFGQRLPRAGRQAVATERRIRTADGELTVLALRDALRLLAANCRHTGRALPDLHAIRINAHQATLILGTDDPTAVEPFTAHQARTWTLDLDAIEANRTADDDDAVDPYPVLVALGVTDQDVIVVNLEAASTLTVAAEPGAAVAVLTALALELGTGSLSATAQLVLTGCPPPLRAMLDSGRVSVLDSPAAATWAAATGREIAEILDAADLPDLPAARAAGKATDVWAPSVLVIGSNAAGTPERPGPGVSVIRVGEPKPDVGWELRHQDDGWTLHPHDLRLNPQRLDPATLDTLADALGTADLPAVDPSPKTRNSLNEADTKASDCAGPPPALDVPARIPALAEETTPAPEANQEQEVGPSAEPATVVGRITYVPARLLLLGPVEVTGAAAAPIERRGRAVELAAFLALYPAASRHHFDEAIWPGLRVKDGTRDSLICRTRKWLGTNPEGQYLLPHVAETGAYRLHPDVTCDWTDFTALAARGLAAGPDGVNDLVAALELVRGRPFLGINPIRYNWAEADAQDMISAIVDAAHTLSSLALAAADHRRARWAAAKGLIVDPCSEILYRDAIRAAAAAGDLADVDRLVDSLQRQLATIDPEGDVSEETAELLAMVAAR